MEMAFLQPSEVHPGVSWGTAADIWSFEVTILVDFNIHIFEPDVPESHELYDVKILVLHHLWFGPFPVSYKNICDQETQASIVRIMSVSNRE